jgi:hypothetical protein
MLCQWTYAAQHLDANNDCVVQVPELCPVTAEVQAEARAVRTAALPRDAAGLSKHVVVTLKAALEERGLDTSGQKAALVARLVEALAGAQ